MNIAVISVHGCPCIPPGGTDAGGMNVYVRRTSNALAQLGHSLTVFARTHPGATGARQPLADGATLVHIDAGDPSATKSEIEPLLNRFTEQVDAHMTTANATDKTAFDVIAAHYWFSGVVGMQLSQSFNTPLVFSYHTKASTKVSARPEERESTQRLDAEHRIAEQADALIVWTREEAQSIASEHPAAQSRIAVSPPGIDSDFFTPIPQAEARSRLGLPHAPMLLFVGRLDAFKGIDLLLETFALLQRQLPDAHLLLAGDGNPAERQFVDDELNRLAIADHVVRLGVVDHQNMPTLYSAADVMLAPSFHETFGLAALEAAACALPTVASDVDGLRAIVQQGDTGYLIAGRAPDDYAARVHELLTNPDRCRDMGQAARRHAERRDWRAVARDLAHLYANVA